MSRVAEAAYGDQPYPETPGHKARETSKNAARYVKASASALRDQVLAVLEHECLTADEVAGRLELSILTVRPRVSELAALAKIVPTEHRRRNASGRSAIVWRKA